MDTYYTPRNPLTAAMNAIVMRRTFRLTVDAILEGLGQLAAQRARAASNQARDGTAVQLAVSRASETSGWSWLPDAASSRLRPVGQVAFGRRNVPTASPAV